MMEKGSITIIKDREGNPYTNWEPEIGPQTIQFLESNVPDEAKEQIRDSALSVLSRSIPPTTTQGHETGLIIGYVQSGKTMSFETVAALARDNNYQMIIVIAGTTTSLLHQSTSRLRKDLGVDDENTARKWLCLKNPDKSDEFSDTILDALNEWRDPNTPNEYKQTILITVLKHHSRLENLAKVLSSVNLQHTSCLIIDDEADQASLNNEILDGDESSTYKKISLLRRILPNHTYLQYTATPQAPLLISLADFLSPNFVQVLEPGSKYIGGKEFFLENGHLIRMIPDDEVPTKHNVLNAPPDTLLEALRIFIVGVAISIKKSGLIGNRSMLVHPSHRTAQHQEFFYWVTDIVREWKDRLDLSDGDPDKEELIEDFSRAYEELARTITDAIPSFKDILPIFSTAFRKTRIQERNTRSGPTPTMNWKDSYAWILIGGQAMDRGFTVEGLTVTYMPRGLGAGNADTVQQRARFFGYKKDYLGYCRVYLEQATIDAFNNYIHHEEDIRRQLKAIQNKNQPLDEWKRAFVLSNDMRPCRDSVLEFDYMRVSANNNFVSHRVAFTSDELLSHNRHVVDSFTEALDFKPLDGHPERTVIQRHDVARDIKLNDALTELLTNYKANSPADSQRNTGLLLLLSRALESNPEEKCTVYLMSPKERRKRQVNAHGVLSYLYQGAFPVSKAERGSIYPGDLKVHETDEVSIQIHNLDLTDKNRTIKSNVPVLAVWLPPRLSASILIQEEN